MWTLWKRCATRSDAELLVALLQSEGIASRIVGEDDAEAFDVEVAADDKQQADDIIEAGPVAPLPDELS